MENNMKKLVAAEAVAVAFSIAMVVAGYILGWSNESVFVAVATVAVATVAVATVAVATVAVATVVVATVVVAFVAVATATTTVVAFATVATVATATVAAAVAAEELKIKYWLVLATLFGEGVAVWVVLCYGQYMIMAMVG